MSQSSEKSMPSTSGMGRGKFLKSMIRLNSESSKESSLSSFANLKKNFDEIEFSEDEEDNTKKKKRISVAKVKTKLSPASMPKTSRYFSDDSSSESFDDFEEMKTKKVKNNGNHILHVKHTGIEHAKDILNDSVLSYDDDSQPEEKLTCELNSKHTLQVKHTAIENANDSLNDSILSYDDDSQPEEKLTCELNSKHTLQVKHTAIENANDSLNDSILSYDDDSQPEEKLTSDYSIGQMLNRMENSCGFIHGNIKCKPVSSVSDLQLHPSVYSAISSKNIKDLTRSQMYGIPVLLQRRNLILVGPPASGKTFAYVLAISSLLFNRNFYKDLPLSNGPLCVFLASNSQNVKEIGLQCSLVTNNELQVLTAYGGGLEKERTVKLTNGCDILVTTPRCWLRLLQSQLVTNMNRLAHVVFDDSDILMSSLKSEVKTILLCFRKLLESRKENSCPIGLHIAVVGEKWTPSHDDCLTIIHSPVVSITSHLEGALYSRIKPITHIVPNGKKIQKLLELLEKSRNYKTVIMCSSEEEVISLRPCLPFGEDKILVAYEGMGYSSLCDICQKWENMPCNFILATDAVLGELAITNAQNLIHFSLPANKSYFSERFSTIQKYFNDRVKNIEQGPVHCWVNILLDDQNVKQFPEIITFIERFNTPIPQSIKQIVKNIRRQKEEAKANALCCEKLFMSGSCKDINKCRFRHIFIKDIDTPKDVLGFGVLKVQLLYIHNPSHYSVRIIAQKIKEDEPWQDFKTNFGKIALKMANYYSKEDNRIPHGKVNVGDMVSVEVELRFIFKRGVVTEILKRNEKGDPITVSVHLIDEGSIKKYKAATLVYLPPELRAFKPEAYDVYICGIQPIDYDPHWSTASTAKLQAAFRAAITNVDDYFFIAKVVLTVGRNMLATSFVCYEWLKSNKCYRLLFSPKTFMLSTKLAETNDKHLPTLMSLAQEAGLAAEKPHDIKEEKILKPNPQENSKKGMHELLENEINGIKNEKLHEENAAQKEIQEPLEDKMNEIEFFEPFEWAHLEKDEIVAVNLICCVSPSLFYLKLLRNNKRLSLLENRLSHILNQSIIEPGKIFVDMTCACINPAVNIWNRALVLELYDEKVDVLFVDYGDTCTIHVSGLSLLPSGFVKELPFQAIECSLVGITQAGNDSDWQSEAADFLLSLTNEGPENMKNLHARVCEITKSENVNGNYNNHYKVLLFDPSADILINKELVLNAFANWPNDSTKTFITNKSYLQSLKDYTNEPIEELDQNAFEYAEEEFSEGGDVPRDVNIDAQTTIECISEDDDSDAEGSFSNLVWTDEMCTDPERLKRIKETQTENNSENVTLNNVIDILSNNDFDVDYSLESLRYFSKDLINHLQTPLQNLLKGEKTPKAIEGPVTQKKVETSSSEAEPASTTSDSDQTREDLSSVENMSNYCRNNNNSTDDSIILFENIVSDVIGRKLEVFKPPVTWSQTEFTLKISVDIPDIKDYLIYTCFQHVIFKCVVNDKIYAFELKLFGPVCKEKTEFSLHGQYFEIKMVKLMPGEWPRLPYERTSLKWLKANVDSLVPPKKSGIIEYFIERAMTIEETPEDYEYRMQLRRRDAMNPYANIPETDSDLESNSDEDRVMLSDNEEYIDYD